MDVEPVGLARFQRLEHLFLRHPGLGRQLGDGGRAAQLLAQDADDVAEPQVQLLHAAGRPHRPALVAEVALQLADDGVGGVGGELDLAAGSKRSTALMQADRRDLHEVVEGLAAVAEAAGQVLGQPEVGLDQLVAERGSRVLSELGELLAQLVRWSLSNFTPSADGGF